jgi:PAS domain S-box-containing protein
MPKNLHLLLVEDSKIDAALILRELNKQGYECVSERVETAEATCTALDTQDWDMVIADYVLPNFSGVSVLSLLKQRDLDVPCIITSGRIDDETAVAAMKAGAKDYIMKDNLKKLGQAVERELAEYAIRKEGHKTEEALRESETKLGFVLEQMPSILWTTDSQLKITSITGAGLAVLSLKPDQLIGKDVLEFIKSSIQPYSPLQAHNSAFSGRRMGFEWDLQERSFYSFVEPLRDSDENVIGIVGIALDVTERKKSEETYRKLASIVESSNDAIISTALDTVITSWNEGAEKTYGYTADEVIGRPATFLTVPENNDIPTIIDKIRKGEKVSNLETTRVRKDHVKISVSITASPIKNSYGEIVGISTIARDITDHKVLERRILINNSIMKLFWEVSSKKEYAEKAIDLIHEWTHCECAGLRVVDELEDTIPYLAQRGFSEVFLKSENIISLKNAQCACIRVIKNKPEMQDSPAMTPGGTFHLADFQDYVKQLSPAQLLRFRGVCVTAGFKTVAVIPIRHRDSILGSIHLTDTHCSCLSDQDIETLESVAELIGQGLYRFDIEDKIRASERRLAEAQNIAHLGNWEWHLRTGALTWSNEVYRIYGMDPGEFSVNFDTFINFVHPDDRDSVQTIIDNIIKDRRSHSIDYRIVLKDSSIRYIRGHAEIVCDQEDNPIRVVGVAQDVTDLKRIEEELRALSRRLVEVQENERRAIARELHDEIGQSLTALKMLLAQVSRQPSGKSVDVLGEANNVVTDLMRQVREMSLNLRPSMLDDLGLLPTLLWHFEKFTTQTGIKIKFEHSGLQGRLPPEINTSAYRVIQEALTNVARYAEVQEAEVTVHKQNSSLFIRIEDKGCGFSLPELNANRSTGISGMRERVSLLHGKLTIEATPGRGTRVIVELPIQMMEGSSIGRD